MVYTCCIPGCTSGYRSNKSSEKVSLFRFPKDKLLQKKWISAIPRKDWNLTNAHRVCAKHFCEEDFQTLSNDKCINRRKNRTSQSLQQIRLKKTAIPRIFSGLPKYLSSEPPVPCSTTASSASARCTAENNRLQKQIDRALGNDFFTDFNEFKKKLDHANIPSGYLKVVEEHNVKFINVQWSDDKLIAPKILASVTVSEELDTNAYAASLPLSKSLYKHLLSNDKICTVTELCNILAFCKAFDEDSVTNKQHSENFLCVAILSLKQLLVTCAETTETHELSLPLINFLIEHLQLMQIGKHGRRYSVNMLTTSFLWKLISTALYLKLRDFFILPSCSRLHNLSCQTTVETRVVDLQYLQRSKDLTEQQRIVTLMIDEVYTAQRVEYSNGAFVGVTETGLPAKTVLTFMIQSTCAKYKDVVCLIPLNKLDTTTLRYWFNQVMLSLHDLFLVIAVSVDNHVCNRYEYYC